MKYDTRLREGQQGDWTRCCLRERGKQLKGRDLNSISGNLLQNCHAQQVELPTPKPPSPPAYDCMSFYLKSHIYIKLLDI